MSPEFGSTCAIFPIDARDAALPARSPAARRSRCEIVEAYAREQGLWHDENTEEPTYSRDAGARPQRRSSRRSPGPKRPQDRVVADRVQGRLPRRARGHPPRPGARRARRAAAPTSTRRSRSPSRPPTRPRTTATAPGTTARPRPRTARACRSPTASRRPSPLTLDGRHGDRARPRPRRDRGDHVLHEHVEPVGDDRRRPAGPQRASSAGLTSKPWVKTSLAPGSKVVMEYYDKAGLVELAGVARLPPRRLRLHDVHRQLRPAAGGDLQRRRRRGSRGRVRA